MLFFTFFNGSQYAVVFFLKQILYGVVWGIFFQGRKEVAADQTLAKSVA